MIFHDRRDAGQRLAQHLAARLPPGDAIVLALPRGGVPVAYEIAQELNLPLDVLVVRKLGAPFNPELAVGAIAPGNIVVYSEGLLERLGLDHRHLELTLRQEQAELMRRETLYRRDMKAIDLEGRVVIIVDDGIATGATVSAAIRAARSLGAAEVVVAVPTCSVDAHDELQALADEVIALDMPEPYIAVGAWYERFEQTSDAEVIDLLRRAAEQAEETGNP